jgi:hypothetical protein
MPNTTADRTTTRNQSQTVEVSLLKLEQMMIDMDKRMDDKLNVMQKSFDDKIDSFKLDIKDELLNKINTNEANIDAHDERLDKLEATVAALENKIEATSKANDLVVKGIPLLSNERPMSIYLGAAAAIGYTPEMTPQVDIFRLGKKKVGSKFDPPLLLRFTNFFDKNAFHRKYFAHKTLSLSEIGFQSDQRVYITENLTKYNQEIYAAAMKLKADKKLHSVSTSQGVVSVKRAVGDRPMPIMLKSELNKY